MKRAGAPFRCVSNLCGEAQAEQSSTAGSNLGSSQAKLSDRVEDRCREQQGTQIGCDLPEMGMAGWAEVANLAVVPGPTSGG